MDTGPIIKVFDSLLTAGAAIGLTATASLWPCSACRAPST